MSAPASIASWGVQLVGYVGTALFQPAVAWKEYQQEKASSEKAVNIFRRIFSCIVGIVGGALFVASYWKNVGGLSVIRDLKMGIGGLCIVINISRLFNNGAKTREKIVALMGIISAALFIAYFAIAYSHTGRLICGMPQLQFVFAILAGSTSCMTMLGEQYNRRQRSKEGLENPDEKFLLSKRITFKKEEKNPPVPVVFASAYKLPSR